MTEHMPPPDLSSISVGWSFEPPAIPKAPVAPEPPPLEVEAPTRRGGRGVSGSARIPGEVFREMGKLYIGAVPGTTRSGLARQLVSRLAARGIDYHVRTVRRQLQGTVSSVPPEAEAELRSMFAENTPWVTAADLEAELIRRGVEIAPEERLSPFVPSKRIAVIAKVYLFLDRSISKRALAQRLSADLEARGVVLSFDSLQTSLAGHGQFVRREVMDQLIEYLGAHGLHSEEAALQRIEEWGDRFNTALAGRRLVSAKRLRRLSRYWQIQNKEASTRHVAQILRERLEARGVDLGIEHIQRAILGKAARVRLDLIREMEALVREQLPEGTSLESALAGTHWDGAATVNLAWVSCEPIVAMAHEWLERHPDVTMRQLALRVRATVRRMGYQFSESSAQSILAGNKKKTRGYVYRAMQKQFEGVSAPQIPEDHLIGAVPGAEFVDGESRRRAGVARKRSDKPPTLRAFIREARDYLPRAKSPHFAKLAALRAERIYGMSAPEALRRIEGRRRPAPSQKPTTARRRGLELPLF